MPANALDLRDVSVCYGTAGAAHTIALDSVALGVAPGECIGIVGGPGAGSTTLMLCAAGLVGPDTGSVRWFGSHRWAEGRAAYVPAGVDGHRYLSVGAWLNFVESQRGYDAIGFDAEIAVVMSRAAIAEFAAIRVGQLTPGVAVRVALAGALLGSPRILLIDRAFDALGLPERTRLSQVLTRIRATGVTILASAREASTLVSLAPERVYYLAGGRLAPAESRDAALEIDVPLPIEARSRLALRVPSVYRRGRALRVPLTRCSAEQVLSECRSLGIEVRASRVVPGDQPSRRRVAERGPWPG